LENINVGCDLIETALKKIGPKGTWAQFNEAVGRTSVSTDTKVGSKHDGGFEMIRAAFFRGEGLGRDFLVKFLPCGDMRGQTINEIINARYGLQRAEYTDIHGAGVKAKTDA
jgi:hypothetical protein